MNSIKRYIPDFLEYCELEKGLSNTSVKNYANFLARFSGWLTREHLSGLTPKDLTPGHIWRYRVFLSRYISPFTKKVLHTHSQGYYLIALRALLSYFVEKNIPSLPPEKVKLPRQRTRDRVIKFLTLPQLRQLLYAPDTQTKKGVRDRAILETFFSTGLRVAELVSLNVTQFDPSLLRNKKDFELTIVGKGSKARTVYFSQRCLDSLKKYLEIRAYEQEPALFIRLPRSPAQTNNGSSRLTSRSIERIIKYYALKAGLPLFVTPHTLRHTYATDLLQQGVDLRSIQEFLGHSSILTTQIYTHVTNKHLREIHKKFHSGNKL